MSSLKNEVFLIKKGKERFLQIDPNRNSQADIKYLHITSKLSFIEEGVDVALQTFLSKINIFASDIPGMVIAPLEVPIGSQYGRINRSAIGFGSALAYQYDDYEFNIKMDFFTQIGIFLDKLARIFDIVSPSLDNLKVYGHEIRSLLLLVCTEVEAIFKFLMYCENEKDKGNMKIFFTIKDKAKIDQWSVQFRAFPVFGRISPFSGWRDKVLYTPLNWYNAYNSTKHNRHINFDQANIENVINSIAACIILVNSISRSLLRNESKHPAYQKVEDNFLVESPNWKFEESYYVIPGRKLRKIKLA
jgi:hypothetical protein